MRSFKPKNLLNANYAFENTLIHNKDDFKGQSNIYLKLNDFVIYPSIADDVEKGDILECTECGMELKVIYVNPVRVERIVY